MSKIVTPEEHARNHRRRRRQMIGAVVVLLVLIGLMTIVSAAVGAVRRLFDDTEARQEYAARLDGLVMFDPLPFEGIENMEDVTLREAAVWGTVYSLQAANGSLEGFDRDPETEQLLLPAVEVDAYLARLVGGGFRLRHQSFEMEDMSISFDEAAQSYLIPVTGGVGFYRAEVKTMFKVSGRLHVTVGYIPLSNSEDLTVSVTDKPTKYMDYLFDRVQGNWCLTGLTESETRPELAPVAVEITNPVVMMDEKDLNEAIMAGVKGDQEPEPTAEPAEEEAEETEEAPADSRK